MNLGEEIAAELASRAVWLCPTCVPGIAVALTHEARTIVIHHSPTCSAVAEWLINGTGPPPGTGRPPT